jgi:hypothetical protein
MIGSRGLRTLFRRLPKNRPVTVDKLGTRPLRFWFLGNRPADPLGWFELPDLQVWFLHIRLFCTFAMHSRYTVLYVFLILTCVFSSK